MKKSTTYLFLIGILVVVVSCEKAIEPANNPFITHVEPPPAADTVDPFTIQGLHKYLFEPKCANPACHDGSFEPDFRTVQSTYSTLVYHPVVKNDSVGTFTYRVVPNNVKESWLIERLTTGDPVLGRMPLYAPALKSDELQWVMGWINNGAQDADGNSAEFPNLPPEVKYYYATDANDIRIDTARVNGWSSPFKAPAASFNLIFRVVDDSTAVDQLQLNELQLSQNRDDFSNAQTFSATYFQNFWVVNLNGANLQAGVQWYMRYHVEDGENTGITMYPAPDQPYWYKENASFIIQ